MRFLCALAAIVALLTTDTTARAVFDLQLTEVYEGVSGDDITEDWVEITNFGTMDFVFGVDGELYYDDSSMDPAEDEQVTGITDIGAGESVVIVLANSPTDVDDFVDAWGASNLTGVDVGYLIGDDPGGLSQGGETLYFFDGNSAGANIVLSGSFVGSDNAGVPGSTWTGIGDLTEQSVDGVQGAFTAPVGAGDFGVIPLVGSPGVAIPEPTSLALFGLSGIALLMHRASRR